jgi:hypothetical protein
VNVSLNRTSSGSASDAHQVARARNYGVARHSAALDSPLAEALHAPGEAASGRRSRHPHFTVPGFQFIRSVMGATPLSMTVLMRKRPSGGARGMLVDGLYGGVPHIARFQGSTLEPVFLYRVLSHSIGD